MKKNFNEYESEAMLNRVRRMAMKDPTKVVVLNIDVDTAMQVEFFELVAKLAREEDEKKYNKKKLIKSLYDPKVSIDTKKLNLARLAGLDDVVVLRQLEKFLGSATPDIEPWAYLAYTQSKLIIETSLLDESKIFVTSGLGGDGHKLRFFACLYAKVPKLTPAQKKTVKGEIEYAIKKHDGVCEVLNFKQQFISFVFLMPIVVDVLRVIADIVTEINVYGDFINQNTFVTNGKIPPLEEIKASRSMWRP